MVSALAALALVGACVAFIDNTRLEAINAQLAKANDEAEFQRYFRHIARAYAGWREGKMVGVEHLLDDCPPDRRGWECCVNLWDARPWTPEAAIEREVVGLLDSLFARPLRKADVVDYLRTAPTIRPRARQLALSLVDGYHEETKPETDHRASWALVRQPYLNAFEYRFALLQAEHACRLDPDCATYRIGLGAA